jgi:ABC-type transport system involved in cytochrome bd biosynthesis fused ATPase/permease subunit
MTISRVLKLLPVVAPSLFERLQAFQPAPAWRVVTGLMLKRLITVIGLLSDFVTIVAAFPQVSPVLVVLVGVVVWCALFLAQGSDS